MTRKSIWGLFAGVLLFQSAIATAARENPAFKDGTIKLEATANVLFEVKLRTLLKNPNIAPPLTWTIKKAPTWLLLDSANEKLTGTPPATQGGITSFLLGVSGVDGGDLDHPAEINVLAPPIWPGTELDLGIQDEGKVFSLDLKTVIKDPADPTLANTTFQATGLPTWMKLTGSTLSGTPERVHVGNYSGIQILATGKGGSATTKAFGQVRKVVKPPKWKAKENSLENAFEDKAYSRNLTEFVNNPEGPSVAITYQIVSMTPPSWLSIGEVSGNLFGTPKKANIGAVTVSVILRAKIDGTEYTDTANFKLTVIPTNHPPTWLADPITLPDGLTKVSYSQDLSRSATDPDDNDKLTYKIESFSGPGTNWATINPTTGILSGTPDKANLGKNSWRISVTDKDGLSDTATVSMTVNKSNEPPYWLTKPLVLSDAKEDFNYEVDLQSYAKDPDNDPLTFTKLDGPNWFSLSSTGVLIGTPGANDFGITSFKVKVADGLSGSDVTDVKILVLKTNHSPIWVLDPIQFTVKEDAAMSKSIAAFAQDKDAQDVLSFSLLEGPSWAKLSSDGTFTGTPRKAEVGTNTYKVRVTDKEGLFKDAVVIITVSPVNHKPFWTQNPISLKKAQEGFFYTDSVSSFADDIDKDPLTFSKVSGPSWITIGANGSVSGTPSRSDVGINEFQVRVIDPSNEFAIATVRIEVEKVNRPPRWRQNPIQIGDAFEDTTFNFNLADFAVDDDGDKLTFKLISLQGSGQAWMFVGQEGSVTGVPMKANLGAFTATFEVTDSQGASAQTTGVGQVIPKNHPPIISPELPQFSMKERTVFTVNLNQAQYVSDPDGDALNFILQDAVADFPLTLSSTGLVTVNKPLRKHVGLHQFRFKVDDGEIPVFGTLRILVVKDPRAPIWLIDPMTDTAKTNELYRGILSDKAKDLDGERLTFSMVTGKPWLSATSAGDLSGTPKDQDLGMNNFTVRACNESGLCTDAKLNINVEPGTKEDVYVVDAPIPNASAENLWVVDNSSHCDKTIRELKNHISVYFNELGSGNFPVKTNGIFLSSDTHKWGALPIRATGQQMLMQSSSPKPADDFVKRVDASYSDGHCGNCYNSPIWAMFAFYAQRLLSPELSSIYHNGYMMAQVPMDVMMITNQRDHYPWYAKNTPQKPWRPEDYAKYFIDVHSREQKTLRVSTIAPACTGGLLGESSGDLSATAAENAYRVVVDKTGGKYYLSGCNLDMPAYLKDYAQRIKARAYIYAKNRIKLSATPLSINSIEVSVGGVKLPGNTGSASDQWNYNASTNEVNLFWHLIDQGQLKPNDEIRIKFRIS